MKLLYFLAVCIHGSKSQTSHNMVAITKGNLKKLYQGIDCCPEDDRYHCTIAEHEGYLLSCHDMMQQYEASSCCDKPDNCIIYLVNGVGAADQQCANEPPSQSPPVSPSPPISQSPPVSPSPPISQSPPVSPSPPISQSPPPPDDECGELCADEEDEEDCGELCADEEDDDEDDDDDDESTPCQHPLCARPPPPQPKPCEGETCFRDTPPPIPPPLAPCDDAICQPIRK
jgi:hypothetical protein